MKKLLTLTLVSLFLIACSNNPPQQVESTNQESTAPVSQELKHVDWSNNATIYEANIRQMTPEGTFKALENQLGNIRDLGVKIIWLMPIQPIGELNRKGAMGSYYSVKDYKAVNPMFGTLDDFKSLVNKAHEMDMKVLIDWVANHTSWDNVWTVDHPEWFTKDTSGNFMPPVPDWSDVIDLNYDNMEMQAAMIDAMKFWVVETDIDGFRCDVAGMVPTDFWNNARKELDAVKPVFMLAEAEQTDLHAQAFDMTYGWELMHIMNHISSGDSTLGSIDRYMQREQKRFDKNDYRMYFLTNHDENSWNGTVKERYGAAEKAYAVLAFTINGMPLIYSGQEYGNNKRLEFFEKDSPHLANPEIYDFYKTLMWLNRNNQALWNGISGGDYQRIKTTDDAHIFALMRQKDESVVVSMANFSEIAVTFKLKMNSDLVLANVFTSEETLLNSDVEITLPAYGFMVLEK